ncbi:MAG TPA: glycerol-3-phosphate responsive antiterminator [Bacillales bacterium]|nr:glycerol-3-phosphate responsive antiterminator [Bacillales bacterium]
MIIITEGNFQYFWEFILSNIFSQSCIQGCPSFNYQGLKLDSYGLTFISKYVKPDGVITTKTKGEVVYFKYPNFVS